MKPLTIKSRSKLSHAIRWVLGISMTAAAALANAAPAEVALPGYYRIDRDTQLEAEMNPKVGVRIRNDAEKGRTDWEGYDIHGQTSRLSLDDPTPERHCLLVARSREEWLSSLQAACPSTIGRPCTASEVQVQREGPDQWKLTFPLRLSTSNAPQQLEQLRRTVSDPRTLSGLNQEQRAQAQAGLKQLPSASAINQSYADLARHLETEAASKNGPDAEVLRKQARRLRDGSIGGALIGVNVERWTRISNHCPK